MVQTPAQTDTYGTALDIFDKTHPLRVDVDENLKVSVQGTVALAAGVIDIGTVDQGNPGVQAWPVSLQGSIPITNAELIAVSASTAPVLLLAANIDTKTFSIFNNSTSSLYVKFGTGITPTFFNFKMGPGSFYEPNIYTFSGDIYGLWDTATGTALISQLF